MGGKSGGASGGPTTVTQTTSPPPEFLDAYKYVLDLAKKQQQQPLEQYQGQLVAPFNEQQNQAFGIVGNQAEALQGIPGMAQPYIDAATGAFGQSVAPLWEGVQQFSPEAVGRYMSPYTQSVVDATQNQFNLNNALQDQSLVGNAITSGAWGGDRAGIARAVLAGQQQTAQAPVIAGLYNQGYSNALNQFNQQQAAELGADTTNAGLWQQAGLGLGNLGSVAQNLQIGGINAALGGANALLGTGQLQQAQQQAELNVPYQQFVQQQSFPWQSIGWLGGIAQGLGTAAGGTASTIYPEPSTASQVLGGATGIAGLLGMTGAFPSGGQSGWLFEKGGRVPRRAYGGIIPEDDGAEEDDVDFPAGIVFGRNGIPDVSRPFIPDVTLSRAGGPPKMGGIDKGMMPDTLADIGGRALSNFGGIAGGGGAPARGTNGLPVGATDLGNAMPWLEGGGFGAAEDGYGGAGGAGGSDDSDWMQYAMDAAKIAAMFFVNRGGRLPQHAQGGIVGYADGGELDEEEESYAIAPDGAEEEGVYFEGPGGATGEEMVAYPAAGGILAPRAQPYPVNYEPPGTSGRAEKQRNRAMWTALAAAGLGIMAGKSPYAAQNIGEGALKGLDVYEKGAAGADATEAREEQQVDTGKYRRATLEMQAARFADAADAARARVQAATQSQADRAEETARHNQAMEGTAAERAEIARKALEQGRYQIVGRDKDGHPIFFDSRTSKMVTGDQKVDKYGKGAGAQDPAKVREANALVERGVASDFASAYAMVRAGVNDGATFQRLVQAEKKLLQAQLPHMRTEDPELERLAQENVAKRYETARQAARPTAPGAAPAPNRPDPLGIRR